MREITGRAAILTGASGGIGPSIARHLASEKVKLVLAALNLEEIEALRSELVAAGAEAISVRTDVRDVAALQALVDRGRERFQTVDLLINNAGINKVLTYPSIGIQEIEDILRTNLTGPMLLARLMLPDMLKRGTGHIVNVASLAGKTGLPYCEAYSATKSGLIAFTESLRAELRGTGVSASVVCPGFVRAGIYEVLRQSAGSDVPWIVGTSSPDLVARAVIRALKKDLPEIIVAPLRTRIFTQLAKLSPSAAGQILHALGVSRWLGFAAGKTESRRPDNSGELP